MHMELEVEGGLKREKCERGEFRAYIQPGRVNNEVSSTVFRCNPGHSQLLQWNRHASNYYHANLCWLSS